MAAETMPANEVGHDPKTSLDTHANMVVLGKHCFVFEWSGRSCSVHPFSDALGTVKNVPIVDAAIAYECPYRLETYILLIRNALYLPTLENNLIPPFIMHEGGVIVRDTAKIHCDDPTEDDHCIQFRSHELRIPLRLTGTFSFFHTRAPTDDELLSCDKIFLTPDSSHWNPYCPSFALNEESMIDYNGNMADRSRRTHHLMEADEEYPVIASVSISDHDAAIDNAIIESFHAVPDELNLSDDSKFLNAISERAEISKVMGSIGSVNAGSGSSCELFSDPAAGPIDELRDILTELFDDDTIAKIAAVKVSHSQKISKEILSKLWTVSEELAQGAIDHNTQLCKHHADNSLSRNFTTNDRMLRYKRLKSVFFTDTLVSLSTKSTRGNSYAQVFVSDKGYIAIYPMQSQSEFKNALHWFCKQVGVPTTLVMDGHKAQKNNETRRFCHQVGTIMRVLEEGTPWANRAELYIGLLKEAVRQDLRQSNAPMVLWDYCLERRATIHNAVPRPLFQNNGATPYEATFGEQGDISNICNFGWYQWVYYRTPGTFPEAKERLGRVLGPAKNEGSEMSQWILTSKGTVVPRRSLRPLLPAELTSESEKRKRAIFDDIIMNKLGTAMSTPPKPPPSDFIPYADGELDPPPIHEVDEDPVNGDGTAVFEKPITDHLINAELRLPQGENLQSAKVIGRSKDEHGLNVGTYDSNPLLNTMLYDVEFPDGAIREYSANIIAENIYAQVDTEGHSYNILDGIVDYKKESNATSKSDKYIMTKSGQRRLRKSTAGWKLLVAWKDGSEQWIPLSVMKESNPIEVAEFAVAKGIDDEPAFCWWVPYTLRKRDTVISAVKARVKRVTHKYGIEIPRTVEEAYKLDAKNGNTFWRDAIEKEMSNLKVAFDILEESASLPPGWTRASGHMVFDVRMTLERKARWVKDGHKTPEPENSTYAGVVSRESVRIALTYAALNNLDVCACDIQNAYLQSPSSEKHYIICGPEFGLENVGKRAKIVRALYGGKSAGADYWRHVRSAMEEMGFMSCKADPDVWFRPSMKEDGTDYYQYVLLYTDDILAIMEKPETFIREELSNKFVVKPNSIGKPTQYLGNKVSYVQLENNRCAWSFSSSQYVQSAVKNVEEHLSRQGRSLPLKVKSCWTSNYRPETDVSPELSSTDAAYYQSLIGVLRWITELGRIDITMETSAMASMMAMPRQGHLEQLYHMFAYLKLKHNSSMVFDPTEPDIDDAQFIREDWSATVYGECKEEIPSNMPEPRGVGFTMRAFVDSDHAGELTTRRSRTGYIIFLNSAPIYWFSKRQTCVETSSFGSEFIAMKQCCEYIRGLRYKLRMMGIPVDLPTYVFGDNQSVLANTTKPHSTLKKKSSSIAYHFVREGTAKDEWRTTYLNTNFNPADMLTKSLPGGEKRTRFISYVLHYLN
jgi:hypothetical protein